MVCLLLKLEEIYYMYIMHLSAFIKVGLQTIKVKMSQQFDLVMAHNLQHFFTCFRSVLDQTLSGCHRNTTTLVRDNAYFILTKFRLK